MNRPIFEPRRFEYQGSHHYFVPERLEIALRVLQPVFLIGLRGTGKTTLLHSLSWKQRIENQAYRKQLEKEHGNAFYDRTIGVYTKLPESKIERIGIWLGKLNETTGCLFALYIDLLWVELIVDAVANLSVREVLLGSASAERAVVGTLLKDAWQCPVLDRLKESHRCCTFKDFARLVNRARRELEHAAESGEKLDRAIENFRPQQYGEFGKFVAQELANFCNNLDEAPQGHKSWVFRICMDEGENLSVDQQKVVNSIYRLARWPLFFTIAYVEMPDVRSTLLRNLTLADADRKLILLTTQTDAEFKEYVEGVVNTRITSELELQNARFNVDANLGRLDLNQILDSVLKESVSRNAKDLISMASSAVVAEGETPPYLETYYDRMVPHDEREPESGLPSWSVRRNESAGYRKKFVAAYLSLFHELGSEVRYAFSDMLLQMSDKCVRDFLSQMNEVFLASNLEINEFLKSTIDWKIQNRGIKAASKEKRKTFESALCVAGAEWLIDGLGYTTVHLQAASARRFKSPELGRFLIRKNRESSEGDDQLNEAILDAIVSGFLRTIEDDRPSTEAWIVQLHTSLAPYYGFSYRGAMYQCEIKRSELLCFLSAESQQTVKLEAKKAADRIGGGSDDMPLFDAMDT